MNTYTHKYMLFQCSLRGWNINCTHCLVIGFVVTRYGFESYCLEIIQFIRRLVQNKLVILLRSANHYMVIHGRESEKKSQKRKYQLCGTEKFRNEV